MSGEWWEREEFWSEMRGCLFDRRREERAPSEADGVMHLLALEPGAKLLDLCCGTGRHAAAFSRSGLLVTGVDRCRAYLDEARQRDPTVEWVEADMREFRRKGHFDAAVNLWSSFGYFEHIEEDLRALRAARATLRPGGALLVDLKGKEIVASHFMPRTWHTLDDGSELLVELVVHDGWKSLEQRWTLLRGTERLFHSFRLRLYSGAELERILRDAGFAQVTLHGNFDGSDYGPEAGRLIAVAR